MPGRISATPQTEAEPHGDDRQSHQATDEGAEEADQRSIGAVREHDRDVQRRAGAGHDLVRNALEGGDEFTEDDTNTVEDDAHTDAELQGCANAAMKNEP